MFTPHIPSTPADASSDRTHCADATITTPFGTGMWLSTGGANSPTGFELDTDMHDLRMIKTGEYVFIIAAVGTVLLGTTPVTITGGTANLALVSSCVDAGSLNEILIVTIRVLATPCVVNFNYTGKATTVTAHDLRIAEYKTLFALRHTLPMTSLEPEIRRKALPSIVEIDESEYEEVKRIKKQPLVRKPYVTYASD